MDQKVQLIVIGALLATINGLPTPDDTKTENNPNIVPGVFISTETLRNLQAAAQQNGNNVPNINENIVKNSNEVPVTSIARNNQAPVPQPPQLINQQQLVNQQSPIANQHPANSNQQMQITPNQQPWTNPQQNGVFYQQPNQQSIMPNQQQFLSNPQQQYIQMPLTGNQQPMGNQQMLISQPNQNQQPIFMNQQPQLLNQQQQLLSQQPMLVNQNGQVVQSGFAPNQPLLNSGQLLAVNPINSGTQILAAKPLNIAQPNQSQGNTLYAVLPVNSGQNLMQQVQPSNLGGSPYLVPLQQVQPNQVITLSG